MDKILETYFQGADKEALHSVLCLRIGWDNEGMSEMPTTIVVLVKAGAVKEGSAVVLAMEVKRWCDELKYVLPLFSACWQILLMGAC